MILKTFVKIVITLVHLETYSYALEDANLLLENIITTSINSKAEPCEDFYSYACGDYAEQNPSTKYKEIVTHMDYKYNTIIFNLLETLYQYDYQVTDHCQSFVEKTRIYLKACQAEAERNITRYFDDIKPGPYIDWPLLEEVKGNHKWQYWQHDKTFNVWPLLGKLQSYGLNNVLISHETFVDYNGELSIILEPAFAENNGTLPDPNILQVLLMGLGVQSPTETINNLQDTDKILTYILENHSNASDESIEITYNDLKNIYPTQNLISYLRELLNVELPADTLILLRNPSYFQYLNDNMWWILKKKNVCNYLMLKFLFFLAVDSTADFNSMACVKDLRNKFDLSVNFLYYHQIYAPQKEFVNHDVSEIFMSIAYMLGRYFKSNHLNLTDTQVKLLVEKLSNVRLNIGNLPEDPTFEKIEKFYAKIPPLDKKNYYKNHLLMLKHRFAKSLHYAQRETFFIVPDNSLGSSSGAFYVAKQNMIILPFGSLLPHIYDTQYHDLFKYSLLGFILAHELTHAFDTQGLNFNGQGLDSLQMLSILDTESYQNSLNCLQSQLATDSINERIADIVAIQVVYKLFVLKYNNLQPGVLNENWNKYFYLNMAQFFCGKKNIEFIDHDADADRLNQIVMNSEGFAKAFTCPKDSKMNPVKKCRLY